MAVIWNGLTKTMPSTTTAQAPMTTHPRPPSPLRVIRPLEDAHDAVLDSKVDISVFSRLPASTSVGDATNDVPGPPSRCATPEVTGSRPAQPAAPCLSVIVQALSPRSRSIAPFSAAYIRVATYCSSSTCSVTRYAAWAGPMPSGGAYMSGKPGSVSRVLRASR